MSQLMDPKTVAMIEPVFDLANRRLRGEISAEEWDRIVDDLLKRS